MENTANIPKWLDTMKSKYLSGISNFFIITGNVMDYAAPGILFNNYLEEMLKKEFSRSHVDVFTPGYDYHHGMTKEIARVINGGGKDNSVAVVKYPEYVYPASDGRYGMNLELINLYDMLTSKDFMTSNAMLIFVTESRFSIDPKFFNGSTRSTVIEVDFPNEEERLETIEYLLEDTDPIEMEISKEELARITAGLTRMGIEDIILQSQHLGILKRSFITERKTELINKEYGEVIEVLSSENFTFKDYAGQEHLKEYHMDAVVDPMKRGDLEIVPKGLLYTGPPGTGKTHFARCLAGEAGINFVELKISKIMDMWVGNSEKRFDKALSCIRSIVPVGVFIDEIDQAFSRGSKDGSGGSRVEGALFSMLLTILSEPANRGKILWIGATNYPNHLDEALKRTGRLDKKMPFLAPEKEDRMKVLNIYLDKSKLFNHVDHEEVENIAEKTVGYTQAELEGIVIKSIELAKRRRSDAIESDDLKKALLYTKKADNDKIQEMTDLAINECNDLEFLPPKYRN